MDQAKNQNEIVKEAAKKVQMALSEMNGEIKEGDIHRISVANDRVQKMSLSMKGELHKLAGYDV